MIKVKRIYADYEKSDGFRILVDRIWPRGIKKVDAHIDLWLKEIAPSTDLRKWFHHDPLKFEEFKKRYLAELQAEPNKNVVKKLLNLIEEKDSVTLLYGAKDPSHNQAIILASYLDDLLP